MSEDIYLNWNGLVGEAINRRKKLKLSQKEHAALSGISIPTMISFERGETSISLQKAIDILNVVGLVTETNGLTAFAECSKRRWFEIVGDNPARKHPHAYFSYSYKIEYESEESISWNELEKYLYELSSSNNSPAFFYPKNNDAIKPYIHNDAIECLWSKTDFWRAKILEDNHKLIYLNMHSNYREDFSDMVNPNSVLRVDLPILKAGKIVLHALKMADLVAKNKNTKITVTAKYSGLENRELYLKPPNSLLDKKISRQNIVNLSTEFYLSEADDFYNIIHQFLAKLYSAFDFYELDISYIKSSLERI